jgi:TRAP-type mannitol/chloroaromatic compound transport system permease small subunit
MRKILKAIDATNELVGTVIKWLAPYIMILITIQVFLRYVLGQPGDVLPILMITAGATLYVLGWGYVYRHDRHVRVDVFYARWSPRTKAFIDVISSLVWLLPWLAFLLFISGKWAWESYETAEWWTLTYWRPPLWPMRLTIFVGVVLLALQSLVQLYRSFYVLVRNRAHD